MCAGAAWGRLLRRPERKAIVALLGGTLAVVVTMEVASILFGLWLVREHGWSIASVATATFAIGTADLCGEILVLVCLTWQRRDAFAFACACFAVLASRLRGWPGAMGDRPRMSEPCRARGSLPVDMVSCPSE